MSWLFSQALVAEYSAVTCSGVAHDNGTWQPQPAGQQQECRLGPEQCSETMANANGNTGHEGRQGDAAQEPGRRNTDRSGRGFIDNTS